MAQLHEDLGLDSSPGVADRKQRTEYARQQRDTQDDRYGFESEPMRHHGSPFEVILLKAINFYI